MIQQTTFTLKAKGSGCSTTIRQVIIEEECLGLRCFIGLFNGAAWPKVKERIKDGSTKY